MVGVSAFQVDEVARLFALDGGGREEARGIVRTHGMSARHAALMCGGALQRTHEVRELQNAYDRSEDHP